MLQKSQLLLLPILRMQRKTQVAMAISVLVLIISLIYISQTFIFKADESIDINNPEYTIILVNQNSPESMAVGNYYQIRRGVPQNQILTLDTTTNDTISLTDYNTQIRDPVRTFLNDHNLRNTIRYIVPTYGIPSKINTPDKTAVDSFLADLFDVAPAKSIWSNRSYSMSENPYWKGTHATPYYQNGNHLQPAHLASGTDIYLVSRLDGTSAKIAKGLVDKALYAGKYTGPANNNQAYIYPISSLSNGPSVICGVISKTGYSCTPVGSGYPVYDMTYDPTYDYNSPATREKYSYWFYCIDNPANSTCGDGSTKTVADWAAKKVYFKEGKHVLGSPFGGPNPLWLVSPGNEYYDIWGNWRPGSIPFHFQSYTAGHTIRDTNEWWSAVVANLLAADVTATTGTVSEPFATGLPQPLAFYDYFLNGDDGVGFSGSTKHYNFAESMYMASPYIKWTNIVIGDPLYKLADDPVTDSSAPKIQNIVYSCTNDKATVSWDNLNAEDGSPEVTFGSIDYGLTNSYGTNVKDETSLEYMGVSKQNYLSQHSFEINDINCSSEWHFKLNTIDPAGNEKSNAFTPSEIPVLTIDSPANETQVYENSVVISYTVDGEIKTKKFENLNVGKNILEITEANITNPALSTTKSISINYIEVFAPNLVINSPEDGTTVYENHVIVSYTADGESDTRTFENLNEGENTLEITVASKVNPNLSTTKSIKVIYRKPLILPKNRFSIGWNMVSFADLSTAITNRTLLPDTFRIRKYDAVSNSYIKGENNDIPLTPGEGYWIKIDDVDKIDGLKYALNQSSSTELSVAKGWALLGNPYQTDLPMSKLSIRYKNGSINSYSDAIAKKEVSGYAWSWEASSKQYLFIAIDPNNYKTTAQKQTVINSYRGFWIIVKSDQISSIIINR